MTSIRTQRSIPRPALLLALAVFLLLSPVTAIAPFSPSAGRSWGDSLGGACD